jgi:S1-C subfamily serine protease
VNLDPGERGESYAYAASLTYEVHTLVGMGSGWAWDEDTIITNWHVVDWGAENPDFPNWVEKDGIAWQIDCIERLDGIDAALVHVRDGPPLTVGAVANRSPVLGEWVLMAGSPHDSNEPCVTWGVMCGWYSLEEIAIDGAIIPGMSGGPVLNELGEVCGMNVATTLPPGRSLGLIIPIEEIMDAMAELDAE